MFRRYYQHVDVELELEYIILGEAYRMQDCLVLVSNSRMAARLLYPMAFHAPYR